MLAVRSERPSWACFRTHNSLTVVRFHREVLKGQGPEGFATGSRGYARPPTPICDQIASATKAGRPEIIDTLAAPRQLREVTVYHDEVTQIDNKQRPSLVMLPRGVRMLKQKAAEGESGESTGSEGDTSVGTRVADGWRYEARAVPATMPIEALDRGGWLHRWSIDTRERTFGAEPIDRRVENTTLYVAYLATVPPALVVDNAEEVGEPANASTEAGPGDSEQLAHPAEIDRFAFLDSVVRSLDAHDRPPQEIIERLVSRPERGLESDGWLAVLCYGDGTAAYYLPPTRVSQRVTNADLFCAAVESRLAAN
jgi:hypothetical protein